MANSWCFHCRSLWSWLWHLLCGGGDLHLQQNNWRKDLWWRQVITPGCEQKYTLGNELFINCTGLIHVPCERRIYNLWPIHDVSIVGYHGPDCDTYCVAGATYTCNITTGEKICEEGKYLPLSMSTNTSWPLNYLSIYPVLFIVLWCILLHNTLHSYR